MIYGKFPLSLLQTSREEMERFICVIRLEIFYEFRGEGKQRDQKSVKFPIRNVAAWELQIKLSFCEEAMQITSNRSYRRFMGEARTYRARLTAWYDSDDDGRFISHG